MSNERISSTQLLSEMTRERSVALRRATLLCLTLLLLTAGVCAAMFWYQVHSLEQTGLLASELRRQAGGLLLRCGLVMALTITGVISLLVRATSRTPTSLAEALQELDKAKQQSHAQKALLQNQIIESERAKEQQEESYRELQKKLADAEQRATELVRSNGQLQEELNKRNRAERALTQRRQELESSKSVLQIHVEARTQELHKLQSRYELILNSAGEGICGLDLDGHTTFANPAVERMTGWKIEELIGKPEKELFYRNGSSDTQFVNSQIVREQLFRHKDGGTFPVEFVKTSINENGKTVGSVLVFKDITERRRVENTLAMKAAELARSNAELEQFAFVASHDLQEPLRKIQAFGDRLKSKVRGSQSAETKDYLDRMQKAAARMQTLINDLLTFSRVIRSSQPFAPVNLATVTREVLGDLEVRIEKTGARVEIGELPTIDADPLQMRQLLLNLIGNALKFQPPGNTPLVTITARSIRRDEAAVPLPVKNGSSEGRAAIANEELCEIRIRDNGIGFDEKYLERIFVVFQRLEGRSDYEGTGVGLAVCRRITDRHGGHITAESKPGEGSTFIITLPVRQSKAEEAK